MHDREKEESLVSADYACASFPRFWGSCILFRNPHLQNIIIYDIIINYIKSAVGYSAVSSNDDNFSSALSLALYPG